MQEYKLRTIKDIFDKVPADRIEDCMRELTTLVCSAKHMAETIRLVGGDVAGEELPTLYTIPEEIIWKDDGEGLIQANFPLGEQALTMKLYRGDTGPAPAEEGEI